MSSHQEALKAHILSLSKSQVFEAACREWALAGIYITEEFDSCPCGQDIKEHCEITNRITGAQTFVGNVCINRFMAMETETLFAGLKRIQKDLSANANEALIAYANRKGYLFERELAFLLQTARKRNLSVKQVEWKEKINRRILEGIVVRKLPGRP
ncbi:MAG TPA: hypothetical protein VLC09_03780 [Polyangiaceae bacterium]|nr:hypothetical protein [Polyangiaceae bacterium]